MMVSLTGITPSPAMKSRRFVWLATLTTEKVLANERLTVVAMVSITEAGHRALAAEY
jgi:hypothetical protein